MGDNIAVPHGYYFLFNSRKQLWINQKLQKLLRE